MLTTDSILPYVLSRRLPCCAQGDLLCIGVEMPSVRTPMDSQDRSGAETVPGMQEPILEQKAAKGLWIAGPSFQ